MILLALDTTILNLILIKIKITTYHQHVRLSCRIGLVSMLRSRYIDRNILVRMSFCYIRFRARKIHRMLPKRECQWVPEPGLSSCWFLCCWKRCPIDGVLRKHLLLVNPRLRRWLRRKPWRSKIRFWTSFWFGYWNAVCQAKKK